VVERRGAELIIRIASNIQYMKNILDVIYEVNNIDSHSCDQNFTDQVRTIIQSKYGLLPNSSTECATSTTNKQLKLLITKETCEEAASAFFYFL